MKSRLPALTLICTLVAIGLPGCGTFPFEPAHATWETAPAIDALDDDFVAGSAILSGFDLPADEHAPVDAQEILVGVKLQRGPVRNIWFVRIALSPLESIVGTEIDAAEASMRVAHNAITIGEARLEYFSPLRTVHVDVFDAMGRPLGSSTSTVPSAYLQHGLVRTCEAYLQLDSSDEPLPDLDAIESIDELPPHIHAEMGSWLALVSLTQAVGSMTALRPMSDTVESAIIRSPGLAVLPALLTGNLSVGLDADFEHAAAVSSPWSGAHRLAPLYHLPLTASVAGHRLVNARLVVGPAEPPYLLSGGILYFEAVHPTNKANRLTVRVIAARRH